MLRLSKKADYALMAMKHLALRGDRGSSSAREIAEQYDIPIELMAKVLQRLVRRGLLASHQGTRGGYQLARLPAQISVADVIQAIDGPVTVTACSTDDGALRAVREVQRARSAVAGARADSGGARRVHDRRAGGRCRRRRRRRRTPRCCTRTCDGRQARTVTVSRREKNDMAIKLPIYMDYHATTPVDPRVVEAMLPYFTEHFGNAASRNHPFGWEAEEAVDKARKQVADLIGANAKEIVFTSGATESDNLAIKGVAEMYREKGNHIITCVTEHKAVIDTCKRLEKDGYRVTYLPVQKDGLISLDDLRSAITDKTILITIMTANNEIGVIQPIAEIGAIAKEKGVLFHTDARAGGRQDSVQRQRAQGRPGVDQRAQDVRAEGRRRAVRAAPESARAAGADHRRRRPRARHALRHAERPGHRRLRQGRGAVQAGDGGREPSGCARCAIA